MYQTQRARRYLERGCKTTQNTITRLHIALPSPPSTEQVRETEVEMRERKNRAEVRERDGAKGSGRRQVRRTRRSYANGSKTGLRREFGFTPLDKKCNSPVCLPNTHSDPS